MSDFIAPPNKLINTSFAEPRRNVVFAAHIDLGKHILKTGVLVPLVHVTHASRYVEERNHLLHVFIDSKGMCLAGRFLDIVARPCNPVVLQITP